MSVFFAKTGNNVLGRCITSRQSFYKNLSIRSRPILISVEGNIGSGKTSYINLVKKEKDVDVHLEPVDIWRTVADTNALKLLYEHPARWSFLFNQYAMLGRLTIQLQESMTPIKMVERSIYSTHYVFVLNNYKEKHLTDLEFKISEDWFKLVSSSSLFPQISHFIYLQTEPEMCLERINKRKRPEEHGLSLEFLKNLHDLHEDIFIKEKEKLPGPVQVVDASRSLDDLEGEFKKVLRNLT